MALPYVPDDEHYYGTLNQGGELARHYTDAMAEENVQGIRDHGALAAKAIQSLPGEFMNGADWRMNRARQQQAYDTTGAEENRRSQLFGPQLQAANLGNQQAQLGIDSTRQTMEQRAHQFGVETGKMTPEEAAVIGHPEYAGMSRDVVNAALGTAGSAQGIASSRAGQRLAEEQNREGTYRFGREQVENEIGGLTPGGGTPTNMVQPAAQNAAPAPGMNLTSYGSAGSLGAPQGAPQQGAAAAGPAQLSDEQVQTLAKKYNISPDAVRSSYRNMQIQRESATHQRQISDESARATLPGNAEVRTNVEQMKGRLQALQESLDSANRYDAAVTKGGLSSVAGLAGKLSPNDSGWIESSAQHQIRENAAKTLESMGDFENASEIRAGGMGKMSDRIRDSVRASIAKETQAMRQYMQEHSRYRDDPEMKDLEQSLQKLQYANGQGVPNVVGNMPPSPQGNWQKTGYFRP